MNRATYTFGLGGSKDICLLGAHGAEYGFYVAFRLTLRHVIPAAFVIATLARPGWTAKQTLSAIYQGLYLTVDGSSN